MVSSRDSAAAPADRPALGDALVASALSIGSAEGWGALTMRRLAGEVGCSPMAAYRHFASREELLGAVADTGFEQLALAVSRAVRRARPGTATRAAARAYMTFARKQPHLYELLYGHRSTEATAPQPRDRGTAVGDAVALAIARDGRDHPPDSTAVIALWAGIHGLLTLRAGGQLAVDERRLRELGDALADRAVLD